MAIVTTTQTLIFGDFGEIWGSCNEVKVDAQCDTKDVSTFGNNGWRSHIPGLKRGTINIKGFRDYSTLEEEYFWNDLTTKPVITVAPALAETQRTGVSVGDKVYFTTGNIHRRKAIDARIGEPSMFDIEVGSDLVPLIGGQTLSTSSSAKTVSGNHSSKQLGAVAAGQSIYLCVHVLAVSGTTPTLTIKLDSDDNSGMSSPTTRVTFPLVSTFLFAGISSMVGPVTDDWWRVSWTITGTAPSYRFVASAGII